MDDVGDVSTGGSEILRDADRFTADQLRPRGARAQSYGTLSEDGDSNSFHTATEDEEGAHRSISSPQPDALSDNDHERRFPELVSFDTGIHVQLPWRRRGDMREGQDPKAEGGSEQQDEMNVTTPAFATTGSHVRLQTTTGSGDTASTAGSAHVDSAEALSRARSNSPHHSVADAVSLEAHTETDGDGSDTDMPFSMGVNGIQQAHPISLSLHRHTHTPLDADDTYIRAHYTDVSTHAHPSTVSSGTVTTPVSSFNEAVQTEQGLYTLRH